MGTLLVDARGLGCPKPLLPAEDALSGLDEGVIDVLVDNEASFKNLTRFASKNGFYCEGHKEDGYWKVRIVKGLTCEVPAAQSGPSPVPAHEGSEKDLLLIIGSDAIGKDETLGKILMKGFFETMRATNEIPHTIFYINAGVKLTTSDEDIIIILKDIEKTGAEIFSCGTCLKHYNLENVLKVGHRGTTNHIVEGIQDFNKTVWI